MIFKTLEASKSDNLGKWDTLQGLEMDKIDREF